jgi:hypothetical protein
METAVDGIGIDQVKGRQRDVWRQHLDEQILRP